MDDLDHDCTHVLAHVDINGCAIVAVAVHRDGCLHGLEQRLFVDAGKDESGVVEAFGAFGACADADCRERVPHGGEER